MREHFTPPTQQPIDEEFLRNLFGNSAAPNQYQPMQAPAPTQAPGQPVPAQEQPAPKLLRRGYDKAWSNRSAKAKAAAVLTVVLAAGGAYAYKNQDHFDALTSAAVGAVDKIDGSQPNPVVYTLPDCLTPVITTSIDATADVALRYRLFADKDQAAKLAADPNYQPKIVEGFFDNQLVNGKSIQKYPGLQRFPFTTSPEISKVDRQIMAQNSGELDIAFCASGAGDSILPNKKNWREVRINPSNIAIAAIDGENFKRGVENIALVKPEGPLPFPADEVDRLNGVLHPNGQQNVSIMTAIKQESLNAAFGPDGSCTLDLVAATKTALERLIKEQAKAQTGQDVTIDWGNSQTGFTMPGTTYRSTKDGAMAQELKDARLSNTTAKCGPMKSVIDNNMGRN